MTDIKIEVVNELFWIKYRYGVNSESHLYVTETFQEALLFLLDTEEKLDKIFK